MPAPKKTNDKPLTGAALIKETCRRIRLARSYWDAHNNRASRGERQKAMALYESLSEVQRQKVPQVLRVWLTCGPSARAYVTRSWAGNDRSQTDSKTELAPSNSLKDTALENA
jgi:hypothetical protein